MTSEIGGTVAVIDVASQTILHEIGFSIPGVPTGAGAAGRAAAVARRRDGVRGAGAGQPGGRRRHGHLRGREVPLVGRRVWHLDLTPDGGTLFTTNGLTNDVSVIDVASLEVVKSTPVGRMPWGVAIRP